MTSPTVLGARGMTAVVIAFTVAALLGHAGALLGVGHGETPGTTDRGLPADPHGAGGSHIASCEATIVNTPSGPQESSALTAILPVVSIVDASIATDGAVPDLLAASRRAPDRPLFLLHASFLI